MPPDRDQNLAGDAIFTLYRAQRSRPACPRVAAAANARCIDMRGDVGRERRIARAGGRAGLAAVEFDHPVIGCEPRGHPLERALAHPLGPGPRHEQLEVGVEAQALLRLGGDGGERKGDGPEGSEQASENHALIVAERS